MARIVIEICGNAASQARLNLSQHPNLITTVRNCAELNQPWTGNYTPETRALVATFLQVLSFGDNALHDLIGLRHGKSTRNQELADWNPLIFGLAIEAEPVVIAIGEQPRDRLEIPFGNISGATVTYPLNSVGRRLYSSNKLPPHRFQTEHLIGGQSFEAAHAVFIGGALDLRNLQGLLSRTQEDFPERKEPPTLVQCIAANTTALLPKVLRVVHRDFGPSFESEIPGRLPVVFTAFSQEGFGETLARRVGFQREADQDAESGDFRYLLDVNALEDRNLGKRDRIRILTAWSWFEQLSHPGRTVKVVEQAEAAVAGLGVK